MNLVTQKYQVPAGDLRHWVEVNYFALTPDGQGGHEQVETVLLTIPCCIRPLTGYEFGVAQQQKMAVTTAIDTRFYEEIKNDMWVMDVDTHKIYAIRAIMNVEMRDRKMTLWCEERRDLK